MKQVFAIILLLTGIITHQALAQGLTKNGKVTSDGAEYVNKNGAVGVAPGVGKHGQKAPVAPTVKTLAVSGIGKGKAILGAEVTDDGGATVGLRGICWSIFPNPLIGGEPPYMGWSQNGTGTGSFTHSLTGLTIGTKYYVRAYAFNSAGIAYGNEISFIALAVGDPYQGGVVAYIFQSGDPGYVAGETHGLIAAAADQSADAKWGCSFKLIGTSPAIGAGRQNTNDIINECATAGIAARLCSDYSVTQGGITYNDWYLPSIAELIKLHLNQAAIGNFSKKQYLSSTESTIGFAFSPADYIEGVNFGGAAKSIILHKDNVLSIRAVRTF